MHKQPSPSPDTPVEFQASTVPAEAAPRYVDEIALAEILKLSERTLQNWRVRGGGPPFYRFGRAVRYRLDEALDWAKEQKRLSTWETQ